MVAQKAQRRLSSKEDAFCRLVAGGATLSEAYRKAYNSDSPNAGVNALRVSKRPRVVARIRELQTPDEKRLFLTRARKREILLHMAENVRFPNIDRQRAIAIDNKMTGDDRIVVRVEGEITLSAVLSAMQGAPALPAIDDSFDVETVHPVSDSSPGTKSAEPPVAHAAEDQGAGPAEAIAAVPAPYADDWSPAFDDPPEIVPEPPKKRTRTYD